MIARAKREPSHCLYSGLVELALGATAKNGARLPKPQLGLRARAPTVRSGFAVEYGMRYVRRVCMMPVETQVGRASSRAHMNLNVKWDSPRAESGAESARKRDQSHQRARAPEAERHECDERLTGVVLYTVRPSLAFQSRDWTVT